MWLLLLLILDILIPWFMLGSVQKMGGSFLFWTVWAVAVIVSAFIILLRWREVEL